MIYVLAVCSDCARLRCQRHGSTRDCLNDAHHGTQTAADHGTNPPRKITYLAGLRGEPKANGTAFVKSEEGRPDDKVAMVDLTYEL